MKYPTIKVIFDRKKVADTKTTKGLVQIEVQSERKRKYISTGVKLYSDQWNDKKYVVKSYDSIELTAKINAIKSSIELFVMDLIQKGESFDFNKLDKFIEMSQKTSVSFIDYAYDIIDSKKGVTESTKNQYRYSIKVFKEFGFTTMDELTTSKIIRFYDWILGRGVSKTTAHSYIRRLGALINNAVKDKLIDRSPIEGIKFDKGCNEKRRFLTKDELRIIKECKIKKNTLIYIRDLFLFQCYTSMAYADIVKFNFSTDVTERNGKYVIMDKRKKTHEDFYIVLLPQALEILEKYNYVLPIISVQAYNKHLKELSVVSGLNKRLTTHMARHTFAVWALNNGMRIEVVSKILGHTNIKTTQIYAKIVSKEIESSFELLSDM